MIHMHGIENIFFSNKAYVNISNLQETFDVLFLDHSPSIKNRRFSAYWKSFLTAVNITSLNDLGKSRNK